MKLYNVIRKSDGFKVHSYSNDSPVEWSGMEFATHDHIEFVETEPPVDTPVLQNRITKLAFRNRFTLTEKVTIEIASVDNSSAPIEQRQLSAALRANMADQRDATFIDLNDPSTRAGVMMLETYGLIGIGRALQILDGEVMENEKLRGQEESANG